MLGWCDSDVIEQAALFATVHEKYVEMADMLIKYLLGVHLKIGINKEAERRNSSRHKCRERKAEVQSLHLNSQWRSKHSRQ